MKRKDGSTLEGEACAKRLASAVSLPTQYLVQVGPTTAIPVAIVGVTATPQSVVSSTNPSVPTLSNLNLPSPANITVPTPVPPQAGLALPQPGNLAIPAHANITVPSNNLALPVGTNLTAIATSSPLTVATSANLPSINLHPDLLSNHISTSSSHIHQGVTTVSDLTSAFHQTKHTTLLPVTPVVTRAPIVTSAQPLTLSSIPAGETSGTIRKSTLSTVNSGITFAERQKRLSEKFNSLIRAKIIELVKQRGYKKTICPSEVARALSPKAWRDLMPQVRAIGTELVNEGIILVTQRGTIVDLATARGPVRFGLAE